MRDKLDRCNNLIKYPFKNNNNSEMFLIYFISLQGHNYGRQVKLEIIT